MSICLLMPLNEKETCLMWDLMFLQWCCWWCKSSGMWHCVIRSLVPEVWKDHGTFSFGVKQLCWTVWGDWHWRCRHYSPSKYQKLCVQWHSITSRRFVFWNLVYLELYITTLLALSFQLIPVRYFVDWLLFLSGWVCMHSVLMEINSTCILEASSSHRLWVMNDFIIITIMNVSLFLVFPSLSRSSYVPSSLGLVLGSKSWQSVHVHSFQVI
jgi:hypothetical protein